MRRGQLWISLSYIFFSSFHQILHLLPHIDSANLILYIDCCFWLLNKDLFEYVSTFWIRWYLPFLKNRIIQDICHAWLHFEREFGTLEDFDRAVQKVLFPPAFLSWFFSCQMRHIKQNVILGQIFLRLFPTFSPCQQSISSITLPGWVQARLDHERSEVHNYQAIRR